MSSLWADLWDRVRKRCPVALMTRATQEYLFTDPFLDDLFDDSTVANYSHQFLFSDLVSVLTGVVFSTYPSVRRSFLNAPAVQARGTLKCFYEKVQRVEPATMRALVRATSRRTEAICGACPRPNAEPIPGRRLIIIDGNHPNATQNRLDGQTGAALPGQVLAVLGHASGLVLDVLPWEDAHSNEKEVLASGGLELQKGDVVVADRQFCASTVMDLVNARGARFVIRHNASVGLRVTRERRPCGRTATGRVYESRVEYARTGRRLRCVDVELDTGTRNGETVIRLLTDVPASVASGRQVAQAYLCRRGIETVFWDLTVSLTCEVETLAYPRAALFAFCVAVSVYNGLQAVKGAVAATHGAGVAEELSGHTMAEEVGRMWDGLDLVLGSEDWDRVRALSASEFGRWLREASKDMDLEYYRKATRGPKKPKAMPEAGVPINTHTSTFRFLQQRQQLRNKQPP
ncbi:transposase [Gemmata sp.]|uniref:transposase n=1 Tax=Gemmata sp. TaxID=1914242 RepID=UPI003F70B832